MSLTIKTNNQWRHLVYQSDVPQHILASEFDYQSSDVTDGFFEYRGHWYHIDQFMTLANTNNRLHGISEFKGWHGYSSDSAFSGVLIKLSNDGEQVMCATYYS